MYYFVLNDAGARSCLESGMHLRAPENDSKQTSGIHSNNRIFLSPYLWRAARVEDRRKGPTMDVSTFSQYRGPWTLRPGLLDTPHGIRGLMYGVTTRCLLTCNASKTCPFSKHVFTMYTTFLLRRMHRYHGETTQAQTASRGFRVRTKKDTVCQ